MVKVYFINNIIIIIMIIIIIKIIIIIIMTYFGKYCDIFYASVYNYFIDNFKERCNFR